MNDDKINIDFDGSIVLDDKGSKEENNPKKDDMIEIWEDAVSLKELMLSLTICLFMSFGGYYLAPDKEPLPLLLGLIGAISGFILSSIMIKPKRVLIEESEE